MFKLIDNFFLELENSYKSTLSKEKSAPLSGADLFYKHFIQLKAKSLDGWKDDKEKFILDLINDIKDLLFEAKYRTPWNPSLVVDNNGLMPLQSIHKRAYSSSNSAFLAHAPNGNPYFITLNAVSKEGGQITDKSKIRGILKWIPIDPDAITGEATKVIPSFMRVINVEFTDGVKKPNFTKVEIKKEELNHYCKNIIVELEKRKRLPDVFYDQTNKCYYSPGFDEIHMVSFTGFKDIADYFSVLFHEIIHSTKSDKRLGRKMIKASAGFGSAGYAYEELVAEIGAHILCTEFGLKYTRVNTVAYLRNWSKATREDQETSLLTAYAEACKAVEYLLDGIDVNSLIPKEVIERVNNEQPSTTKTTTTTKEEQPKAVKKTYSKPTITVKEVIKEQPKEPTKEVENGSFKLPKTAPEELSFEIARRAYLMISFDPEKRGRSTQEEYANDLNRVANELENVIKSKEQFDIALNAFAGFKEKYKTLTIAWLNAKSRCASTMITGGSGFNVRRNEKANEIEHKRLTELIEYYEKQSTRILKAIQNGASPEVKHSEEWEVVKKRIDRAFSYKFFKNLQPFIERLHTNGKYAIVNMALDYIKEQQQALKIVAFAPRNSVWTLQTTPGENSPLETEKSDKEIYNNAGCKVIDEPNDERVRIYFDEKPTSEIIAMLKKNAFKWSPSNKAWQRQNTPNGKRVAEQIAILFFGKVEPKPTAKQDDEVTKLKQELRNTYKNSGWRIDSEALKKQRAKLEQAIQKAENKPTIKTGTKNTIAEFNYLPENNNIQELDEERSNDILTQTKLKEKYGSQTPRYAMIKEGIPFSYDNKSKLYFYDLLKGQIHPKQAKASVKKLTPFEACLLCVSNDPMRPVFNGVFHDAENSCMVSSDGSVLVRFSSKIEGKSRILAPYPKNKHEFAVVDAKFPNYNSVIPRGESVQRVRVDLQALLNECASIIELKKLLNDANLFRLTFITDAGECGFDAFKLANVLKAFISIGVKEAFLDFYEPDKALIITDCNNSKNLGLVMPVKLKRDLRGSSDDIAVDSARKTIVFSNKRIEPTKPLNGFKKGIKKEVQLSLTGYKWKPSASARREFAKNMQDENFKNAYEERKRIKQEKKRATSKFDYTTAGGEYVPTKAQFDFCLNNPHLFKSDDEKQACNMIMYGYSAKEKIHHDFIHIVNEKIRSNKTMGGVQTEVTEAKPNNTKKKTLNGIEPLEQETKSEILIQPELSFSLGSFAKEVEKTPTYKLKSDLGKFIGAYDRVNFSIVLRGEKGAGKSRLLFQLLNAFALENLKCAFLSLEMSPQSSVIQNYKETYLKPEALQNIDVSEGSASYNYQQLNAICKKYDVVAIDSWTKLKDMQQTDFDRLQKENPKTIIIAIFQSTTGKVTRGGNMPEYDAGIVIQVNKGGNAECEKNRYAPCNKIYNVFAQGLVEELSDVSN